MIPLRKTAALSTAFFDRDPRAVARALLGKLLVRKNGRHILAGRIVETEAYLGKDDDAAHSAAGKTPRNSVLFGPPGFAYVYFIYGNHFCLNVSCLPDGVAGGVLFRALEPVAGIEEMAETRGMETFPADDRKNLPLKRISWLRQIASGPGRLADAFGVTRERDNGKNLAGARSDLRIEDDGFRVRRVLVTPRIGITKSAEHPLRYVIAGNPFVSGPRLSQDVSLANSSPKAIKS